MRQFLFSIFFFLFTITLFGQEASETYIDWGQEMREPAGSSLAKIIATGAEGFYGLRIKQGGTLENAKVIIEHYGDDMNVKKAREIDLKYKKKNRVFQDIVMVGRQLYLITSFHNEAKKKNYLFRQKIHNTRLTTSERDLELISEIDTRSVVRDGSFDIILAKDSSKVLIYNKLPTKNREAEQFNLKVYDDSFEMLWSKDITLPYDDKVFRVEEYRVDKAGNAYLMGVIFKDGVRVRRNGQANYEYVILAYTNQGALANEYRINLEDVFVTDLTFRVAKDGDLVCSGFYSERGTYSMKGTYFFRLDAETKEIYNQNLKEFDFEFLTENYGEGQKARAERAEVRGDKLRAPELYRFALDDLILRSDGGALLIAEQFYVQEYTNPVGGYSAGRFNNNYQREFYYYYNDIIVVNIKPDGGIEWATRIPKRQVTRNDGGYFSSYAMSIVRDKLYFVYNDNRRNLEEDNRRLHNFDGRNSIVVLSEINKTGDLITTPLFPNREMKLITRPKICRQIGRKSMAIYAELRNKFRFADLQFD